MDPDFWHERWQADRIGFHESEGNSMLVTHFNKLSTSKGERIFVPLCGKTRDIAWLLSKEHQVVAVELSELAVEQLFAEIAIEPQITELGELKHFGAPDLDIFVGDIFELTPRILGAVNAVYDRAALVALPEKMRVSYAKHIADISINAPQLLITFEYDQSLMAGPPFSIDEEEIRCVYKDRYEISLLASAPVAGGLKGKCPAKESVWLLRPIF